MIPQVGRLEPNLVIRRYNIRNGFPVVYPFTYADLSNLYPSVADTPSYIGSPGMGKVEENL